MPSKNQRVASRQAKVRNKRKRVRAAPQAFQAGPTQRRPEDEEAAAATPRAVSMATRAESEARPERRARRVSDAAPAAYPYMKPELLRIGATSAVIFAVIAVLTFILG